MHTCHVGETHTHLWLETCDGKTRAAACRLQLQARLCCGDRRSLARFSHTTSHRTARAWTLGLLRMDMRTCMPDARDQASITAAVRVRGYVHHLPTQARARCSRRRSASDSAWTLLPRHCGVGTPIDPHDLLRSLRWIPVCVSRALRGGRRGKEWCGTHNKIDRYAGRRWLLRRRPDRPLHHPRPGIYNAVLVRPVGSACARHRAPPRYTKCACGLTLTDHRSQNRLEVPLRGPRPPSWGRSPCEGV